MTVELHSIVSEQALIGSLLANNNALSLVEHIVQPDHYYEPLHAQTAEVLQSLIHAGRSVNPVTIRPHLPANLQLGHLTLGEYLARLAAESVPVSQIVDYAWAVRDFADRRAMAEIGGSLMPQDGADIAGRASEAIAALDALASAREPQNTVGVEMSASVDKAIQAMADAYERGGKPIGIPYDIKELDDKLSGASGGDLIIIAARPSQGKEQPVDMPVLTPNGWLPIGKIKVGDFVVGQNGKPVMVKGVYPQGIKDAYRVTFLDGTFTECGLDHLWEVRQSDGRSREKRHVKTLRELLAKGITRQKANNRHGARWRIPLCEPVEYPTAALPVDPYCLGVLIGDGALSGADIRFSNPDIDSDIRHEFMRRAPHFRIKEGRYGQNCPYYAIMGGPERKELRAYLRGAGLAVKSGEKFIPAEYLRADVQQRKDLLAALMDTDGSTTKGRTSFSTTAYRLAVDLMNLVRSLGGIAILRYQDRSNHGKGIEYQVVVKTNWCPFYTSRKVALWCRKHPISKYIWDVRLSRKVEQVCISVDSDDGLYLTNDYIVTHNTSLALAAARNFAKRGKRSMFWSLEMPDVSLTNRMISDELYDTQKVKYSSMRSGRFRQDDFMAIRDASRVVAGLPIRIEQPSNVTVGQICARSRQYKRRNGLDAIFIDHLGYIRLPGRNQVTELGEVTKSLKGLARELNVPIFVLCQLNRGLEAREDKRPNLSDLRASGTIEEDADTVMMVYRDAYYLEKKPPAVGTPEYDIWQTKLEECINRMTVIIEKNRGGPVGALNLFCDMACNAVRDADYTPPRNSPPPPATQDEMGF